MSKNNKLKKAGTILLVFLLVIDTLAAAHYIYRKIEARIPVPEPEPLQEPVPQSLFEKYEGNPVLGDDSTGSFFDPFVMKDNDEYRMYVSDRDNGSIVLSTSRDGISWSKPAEVLGKDSTSGWEEIVNRCSVAVKDGTYYLYYTGQQNNVSRIGVAVSKDGKSFDRIKTDCILSPEENWEGISVMNPFVIYDGSEGLFKMWYSCGDTFEPDMICYATSTDGISFEKYAYNPIFSKGKNDYDHVKVSVGHVVKLSDNEYLMFYIGYKTTYEASICAARSKDGITGWERSTKNPLIVPTPESWDQSACYKPTAVYDEASDKWMLWYNGRNDVAEYIGFATYSGNIY